MSSLAQYQEMERKGNFYKTMILDRDECLDSKYINDDLIG